MSEAGWLGTHVHAQSLVWELRGTSATRTKIGRRKLRLFGCACCRLLWDHLWDDRLRRAVEVAELFAEGRATKQDLETIGAAVQAITRSGSLMPDAPGARQSTAASMIHGLTRPEAFSAAFYMTCYALPLAGYCGDERTANGRICALLRDAFGNPFSKVNFDGHWRTDTAVSLARTMYESRDFLAMPILADALQDAGCDNEDILHHCRDAKGVHVRGCWVVDLVLANG